MALPRFLSPFDFAVLVVAAVALFLPPREMYAQHAIKGDDFGLALAEARTIASAGDGKAIEDFTRKLGEADLKDWAIESSVRLSERAKESPTRWRALIAASGAYIEKLDVVAALDYANRALAACEATRERGDAAACPSWEEIRMRLYHQQLDAGVKSGIDPRVDPAGFRAAGESAMRNIRLGPAPHSPPETPAPTPAPGDDTAPGSAQ